MTPYPRNRPLRNRLIRTEPRAECRPWGFLLVGTFVVADLCVLLGLAGAWLSDPKTLPIREVFIEGEFRQLKPPALEALVARQVRGGFFTVPVAEVQHGLRRDPWVKAASVSREWPDGLRVTVYEQRAVARFGERGLLNPEGVLFTPPAASYPAGLPLLDGPEGTEAQVLMRYHRLAELLDRAGLAGPGPRTGRARFMAFRAEGRPAGLGRTRGLRAARQALRRALRTYRAIGPGRGGARRSPAHQRDRGQLQVRGRAGRTPAAPFFLTPRDRR